MGKNRYKVECIENGYWLNDSIKNVDIHTLYRFNEIADQRDNSPTKKEIELYECVEILTSKPWRIKAVKKFGLKRTKRFNIGPYLRINHPYIARLKEVFETKTVIYFVTERTSGVDLLDRIEASYSAFSEAEIIKSITHILEALQYLHSKDLYHGHIKAVNLVTEDSVILENSTLKLTDFYFSEIFASKLHLKTICCLLFSAPEQFRGTEVNKAVDMWAVGMLAFLLLNGREPFYAPNHSEMFKKILKCDYTMDTPEMEAASQNSKDFIRKLLIVNPKKRMSARDALRHPWIAGKNASTVPLETTMEGLRDFNIRRRLQFNSPIVTSACYDTLHTFEDFDESINLQLLRSRKEEELSKRRMTLVNLRPNSIHAGESSSRRRTSLTPRGYGLPFFDLADSQFDEAIDEYSLFYENEFALNNLLKTHKSKSSDFRSDSWKSDDLESIDLRFTSDTVLVDYEDETEIVSEKELSDGHMLKRISSRRMTRTMAYANDDEDDVDPAFEPEFSTSSIVPEPIIPSIHSVDRILPETSSVPNINTKKMRQSLLGELPSFQPPKDWNYSSPAKVSTNGSRSSLRLSEEEVSIDSKTRKNFFAKMEETTRLEIGNQADASIRVKIDTRVNGSDHQILRDLQLTRFNLLDFIRSNPTDTIEPIDLSDYKEISTESTGVPYVRRDSIIFEDEPALP